MNNSKLTFKTIQLERTMCYGDCPVYKVSVHHSGRVTFTGNMFVEKLGRHIWYLENEAMTKLSKALIKCDYFNLQKIELDEMVWCTDMPYCNTSIELIDGTKRKIEHYLQDPDEWPKALIKFEEEIDKIIGVEDYVVSRDGEDVIEIN